MIETSVNELLKHAKKKKKISKIPANPVGRIDAILKLFKKDKNFLDVIELYEMFKRVKDLRVERIGEFRKNVTLKIFYKGKETNVNLDQLKIYTEMIENFVSSTKKYLSS